MLRTGAQQTRPGVLRSSAHAVVGMVEGSPPHQGRVLQHPHAWYLGGGHSCPLSFLCFGACSRASLGSSCHPTFMDILFSLASAGGWAAHRGKIVFPAFGSGPYSRLAQQQGAATHGLPGPLSRRLGAGLEAGMGRALPVLFIQPVLPILTLCGESQASWQPGPPRVGAMQI